MSTWSLTQCFIIGFIPGEAEDLMPDMLDFDIRLLGLIQAAFDNDIF